MTEHAHLRPYNPDRDRTPTHRIWQEVGWIERGKENHKQAMDALIGASQAWVAELRGEAESLALTTPGTIRYQNETLKLSAVTGVTTSRVARKQGFAKELTARIIANDAADGAVVAGLGMFDQGFYNRLGFGTLPYMHRIKFDPETLQVDVSPRTPHRLGQDDWQQVHNNLLHRLQGHGSCCLIPSAVTKADMLWSESGFGLGYFDDETGELTHHFWANAKNVHGPYTIWWLTYRSPDELLELLGLLKTLANQVYTIQMAEPRHVQFQDLLREPFRRRNITKESKFENGMWSSAYQQLRILDIESALEHTHLAAKPVRFNLALEDPIERYLGTDAPWRGVGGDYVIELGPDSQAEPGQSPSLPTLHASIGAFTRLWMGVRPATSLAITDRIAGPTPLLQELDRAIRLPKPVVDWDF